jgi:hypothetical protein
MPSPCFRIISRLQTQLYGICQIRHGNLSDNFVSIPSEFSPVCDSISESMLGRGNNDLKQQLLSQVPYD